MFKGFGKIVTQLRVALSQLICQGILHFIFNAIMILAASLVIIVYAFTAYCLCYYTYQYLGMPSFCGRKLYIFDIVPMCCFALTSKHIGSCDNWNVDCGYLRLARSVLLAGPLPFLFLVLLNHKSLIRV